MDNQPISEIYGIVELMGHLTLAGRVTKPGDHGGLWQIDIPDGESFHTEFFGSQSVYRIRIVSENIARAYVSRHEIIEYNAPIITQAEHQAAMDQASEVISKLRQQVDQLKRGLPPGYIPDENQVEDSFDDEHSDIVDEEDYDIDEGMPF